MPAADRSRSEGGIALVLVAVIGFLTLALFMMAIRSGHDSIRGERFQLRRQDRAVSVTASVADGLRLLETGTPPTDPYECIATQTDGEGNDWYCKVTYDNTGVLQYDVTAQIATDEEVSTLPAMPGSF